MSNEITVDTVLKIRNPDDGSGHDRTWSDKSRQFNQTAIGEAAGIVSIGTTQEPLAVGDIGTEGWMKMKNLDTANFVQWGPGLQSTMVPIGRMEFGESALFRMEPGTTMMLTADTAAVKVQFMLLED